VQLARVDPGFQTEGRIVATTILPQPKYAEATAISDFYSRVLSGLQATPTVQAAALVSIVPMSGGDEIYSIDFEGRPPLGPGQGVSAIYYLVSPEYFTTMGIQLKKGRLFTDADRAGATRVAIVNDAFVRLHYPNEDPIGQRIRMGRNSNIVREIVGVVGTVTHYALNETGTAQMYEPFAQFPAPVMNIVVRADAGADASRLGPVIRSIVQQVDAGQPVANVTSLSDMVSNSSALPRVQAILLGVLAAIALVLACVGLYGVMTYSVSQRTQEIGIRMTLGANRGSVLMMVLRQAVMLTGLGLAIGLAGAVALGKVLESVLEPMLFRVPSVDVLTLAGVSIGLAAVALLASLVPARRATKVDPIRALRSL
jgi:putative ABC transport system permease protein